ncbi:metallophosphoesterase family protein [Silicimonas sp. MF1-12-2]|uniref:metallophosphoesterase family protein n=1 Tax=Silicimonas sp. MF1-12-2 TaxID=3384793 RepID=UPI0039B4EFB3
MKLGDFFRGLFGRAPDAALGGRDRLSWPEIPDSLYVIGDVHGCLSQLKDLERQLLEDAEARAGRAVMVLLGDLVDRGPRSAEVIDHLLGAAPSRFERVVLCGNHDAMFLEFLAEPSLSSPWLGLGGEETLRSYGIELDQRPDLRRLKMQLHTLVPPEHVGFLSRLPVCIDLPGYFLVHAGVDPERKLSEQRVWDMLMIRDAFLEHGGPFEKCIVHGHTAVDAVEIGPDRIAVDTGAYGTGLLSAVRLAPNEKPQVFSSGQ